MSREYGIRPQDMAAMKPWHIDAMLLDLEQRRSG